MSRYAKAEYVRLFGRQYASANAVGMPSLWDRRDVAFDDEPAVRVVYTVATSLCLLLLAFILGSNVLVW